MVAIMKRKANWMPKANIRGFFDSIRASPPMPINFEPVVSSIVERNLGKGYITTKLTSALAASEASKAFLCRAMLCGPLASNVAGRAY